MKRTILVFLAFSFIFLSNLALSFTSGLEAIAIHPTKNILAVGGEMKNLVILDKSTFAVLKKIELNEEIVDLSFSADGSMLVAYTDSRKVFYLETETWTQKGMIEDASKAEFSAALNLLAIYNFFTEKIHLYSMTEHTSISEIALGEIDPEIIGFDVTRKQLLVYESGIEDSSEPELTDGMIPENLPDGEEEILEMKYDQEKAVLHVFSIQNGSKIFSHETFYSTTSSFACIAFGDGKNYYVNGWDDNIMVFSESGFTEVLATPNTYCYGAGYSIEKNLIISDEYIYNYSTKSFKEFKTTKSRDWTTGYLHDYVVDADGTIFGVTSKYVIFKMSLGGEMLKQEFIDLPTHLELTYIKPGTEGDVRLVLESYGLDQQKAMIYVDAILNDDKDLIVYTSEEYEKVAELEKKLDDLGCSTNILQE